MPGSWIDRLARSTAVHANRRQVLGAGGAAAIAGLTTATVRAQDATPMAMDHGVNPFTQMDGSISVRKSVANLSPEEKATYVNAVLALKQKPSPWMAGLSVYDTFVAWHRDAFGCATMAAHMGPAFLPWHRVFLRLFELQLQEVEPTATVPYWDWTVDNTPDAAVWGDDFMGGDGDPAENYKITTGPFNADAWEIKIFDYGDLLRTPYLVRSFGQGKFNAKLPTPEELEVVLGVSTYDSAPWNSMVHPTISFRNAMEGWRDCVDEVCDPDSGMGPICAGPHLMHNGVHLWVAGEHHLVHQVLTDSDEADVPQAPAGGATIDLIGTMAFNTSTNDPVFFQHHANIDRLWGVWMSQHGQVYAPESGGPLGHNIDDLMWPYHHMGIDVTPGMMLDSAAIGVAYE
jgi:tyrosinase